MTNPEALIYDFGTMQAAAGGIETAVTRMQTTLSNLEADLRPLEGDSWSSDAQQAYLQRKQRWQTAAQDINTTLTKVKVALQGAAEGMQAQDKKATGYF